MSSSIPVVTPVFFLEFGWNKEDMNYYMAKLLVHAFQVVVVMEPHYSQDKFITTDSAVLDAISQQFPSFAELAKLLLFYFNQCYLNKHVLLRFPDVELERRNSIGLF
jgi:hypothetical protein